MWSNTGREVAFFSTARDGVSHDIDIVEPEAERCRGSSSPATAPTGIRSIGRRMTASCWY